MDKYQKIKKEIIVLFHQLPEEEQSALLQKLQKDILDTDKVEPKNLKNLMNERGISKGMYGNVEGFLNNEENIGKRAESAFKNKSMSDAIKAMRAKRNRK